MNETLDNSKRDYEVLRLASIDPSTVTLSIIIPNYNTAQFVEAAIQSAVEQTFTELEIIVVDDGSTDNSVERILSFSDKRLTCIRQKNRGLAGARNTGIALSRGEFIGFLDSDDIWYPEKADSQLRLMRSDPTIGLTFSYSVYLDEAGRETGQYLTTACASPTARDLVFRNHLGNGSTAVVRRECFVRAGAFDESLRYVEDLEMWIRIKVRSDLSLRLVPKVLTGYRVREGSMSSTLKRIIPDAEIAVERFRQLVPALAKRDLDRAFAQIVRVSSRKAFSNGQFRASRNLLGIAWRRSPTLPFYDFKALVLIALNTCGLVLPENGVKAVYDVLRQCVKRCYTWFGLQSPART